MDVNQVLIRITSKIIHNNVWRWSVNYDDLRWYTKGLGLNYREF